MVWFWLSVFLIGYLMSGEMLLIIIVLDIFKGYVFDFVFGEVNKKFLIGFVFEVFCKLFMMRFSGYFIRVLVSFFCLGLFGGEYYFGDYKI